MRLFILALSSALVAAGDALSDFVEQHEAEFAAAGVAVTSAAPAVAAEPAAPSIADKVRDFLSNDTSGYERRSAKAIGQAIGHTESEVADASRASSELETRNSTSGMGVLVSLRD